jgi:hypothetical protein
MPDSMTQIASGEDRPFIQMTAPALLRLAEANWNDVFCLYQIAAEARIRVWKKPKSKANGVLETVRPQLEKLYGHTFPDDPDPQPGPGPFPDASKWPKVGLLKHMGYSTGNADPGTATRRKILRKCFEGPVPNVHGPDYMQEWGRNKTPQRLSKMAWSIATFASNQINKNGGHVDEASRLWKEDLQWLRTEFYEGHFGFPWPSL